ncbi:GNAT family N-acetyltransferase [Mycobacterium deserti]|uniref:GNAT family N-acetyltransferase n=1 Tax=Mycobacterium deserti TaxID=2978347 RepID=A0ABT2M3K8_9MYCO|nr:GNAT family N-acetyltransferase [Mycobacterium deserti]MCT7656857.1 GNAT family N-acetyltransferase [Mycobacterium deserti]
MTEVEVLNGSRVTLRIPTLDDAEPLFERIASDPEVSRYMSWPVHRDVEETRRVITGLFNVGGETTWLIDLRDSGDLIGAIGWRRPQRHIIDFGYYLGRPWWGRGYMSEAVQLILDKAHRDDTVFRVSAYCSVENTASARVLERCGLTCEGRLVRYAVLPNIGDEPQDCLLFAKAVR